MVDWATWVSVVTEVVDEAGAEIDADVFGSSTQAASVVWKEDKAEIKTMNRAEAKAYARANIDVSF